MLLRDGVMMVALGVWLLAAPACGGDTSDVGGGTGGATGGSAGTSAGTGGTSAGTAGANGSAGTNGTAGTNGSAGAGGSGPVDGGDVCSLPREVGDCRALIPRFWFNAATGRCESFTYGGCGGNANNFETPSECVESCAPGTGNVCSKVTCDEGAQCVFVGAQPAACLRSCDDPGACPPSMTCECGGSCPGCEDCRRVCVPL